MNSAGDIGSGRRPAEPDSRCEAGEHVGIATPASWSGQPLPKLDRVPARVPAPLGAYEAVVLRGAAGFVSGQFPIVDGRMLHPGRLGDTLDLRSGREAARAAALNVLGQIDRAVPGGLRAIELARVDGCIVCTPGFDALPAVLDAASQTFIEFLGHRGQHARGLVPIAHLPGGAAIELLVSFTLSQPTKDPL